MSTKQVQINALVQSGNEFRERGELDKAIAQYSQALNLRPNCFKALNQLASLYESRQEFNKAIAYYEQVVQLEPESSRAWGRLARSMMGNGKIETAIATYQRALSLSQEKPAWIYHGYGDALGQNGQWTEAIAAWKQALQLEPVQPEIICQKLAEAYKQQGQIEAAYATYEQALKLWPNNSKSIDCLVELGDLHRQKGNIADSITAYEKALQLAPDNPNLLASLGRSYFELGNLNTAIDFYRQAIKLKQVFFPFYQGLGEVRKQQRKLKKVPKSKLVICAILKNESPYLLEWIAYYRVLKVDHFLLYNNDSTDCTPELLQSLDRAGIVTYIDWPSLDQDDRQLNAYKDAYTRAIGRWEWIAFIDLDEFIVPTDNSYDDLNSCLDDYADVAGIAINWKIFGSSGQLTKTHGLLMERFTKCAIDDFCVHKLFKTIAKVDLIQQFLNAHKLGFDREQTYIYPDGTPVPREEETYINHSVLQINHYFTKSKAEWELKRARGSPSKKDRQQLKPATHFKGHDRNEKEDTQILKFLERTKKEIDWLIEEAKLEKLMTVDS